MRTNILYKMKCVGYLSFTKCFHWNWHYSKKSRTCHPVTSCLRDQDAITAPVRLMWETAVADLHSKILDAPPPGVQILSISCSFWEFFVKSYVGAHLGSWRPLFGEILDPPLDRILKLSPIHALVIYQIPWIQWIPVLFRDNPNIHELWVFPQEFT